MKNIKKLLGLKEDAEVTLDDVEKFLEGKKLVDLSNGNYVDKDKYEKAQQKQTELESKIEELTKSNVNIETLQKANDSLKKENETYKQEKHANELSEKITKAGVKKEFVKFIASEVKDGDKFDDDLKEYLKNNPQYIASQDKVIDTVNDVSKKSKGDEYADFRKA